MQGFNNQFNNNRPRQNNRQQRPEVEEKYTIKHPIKKEWFVDGADDNLVKFAEEAGKAMANAGISSSQIRNIYGEIKRIQMAGFESTKSSFFLLKPKVAYAYGRDDKKTLKIFKEIFDEAFNYVTDEKSYQNFCNFMEALLAYHKANGGKK